MLKRFILLVLIGAGLVWTYYWYVRGINLLLEEQLNELPPINWAVRVPADDQTATEPTWSSGAPMPTPRTGASAALVGREIFVVGGFDALTRTVATVEAYDYEKDEWRSVAPMPVAVHHTTAIGFEGKLYVFGGLKGLGYEASKEAFIYDPVKATWRQLGDLPHGFGSAAAAVVNGRINLFGGESPSQIYEQHLVYDAKADTWQDLDNLSMGGRDRWAAVVAHGKVWLLGGRGGSLLYNTSNVWTWDYGSGLWDESENMLSKRSSFAAGVGDRLYVMGGAMPTTVNTTVEAFDFTTNRWELLAPMPRPRFDTAFVQVENRIFMIGGSARVGFSVSDLVDVLEVPPAVVTPPVPVKKP
jgi:N-acetylneuraminic acid mutarotase